ncbi:MAG: ATP-binding cassette domain-containing protein [Gammaproteobacteria bacterium]|nr:ATP-binding cassette domain-containing protein [Gammaproteobacteria bacterium]MYI89077.1 ATP-binding cassette domain-containing protein [Gammaproteobacteria bacterium]
MSLLNVQNVSIRFGGVDAVRDVSLAVEEQQLLGFIGPNGAGKTTMMRIIMGMVRPQQGSVRFRGKDITQWSVHHRVQLGLALAQQIVKPLHSLTMLDNVALAAGARHMRNPLQAFLNIDRSEARNQARKLLDFVGIGNANDVFPSEVPLGFIKRMEVARALALEPWLLLLDEPLAGLNQTEARDLADLIASLVTPTRSVLLIEHNIGEVARICSEIYVQENGQYLMQDTAERVMASAALRQAYLGEHKA